MKRLVACSILPLTLVAASTMPGCEESSSRSAATTIGDPQMEAASARGKSTLPLFLKAFRDPEPGWSGFQVRYAFINDSGFRDSVWLELQSINDRAKLVTRVPADEDERTARFEPGSELVIDQSDVSDWLFLDRDGTFVGGYTLRITMDRIGGSSGERDDNIHGGIPFRDLDTEVPDTDS